MSKKSDVLKIWQECFPGDSLQWRRMFFDSAYVDEEALTMTDPETGATVSSLLLLSYFMTFQGRVPGVAYIYGAGTLRRYRVRGFMSRLMKLALREAADRGDTFAVLIPASESLRLYYRRFGFSTVFFYLPQRYSSAHRFRVVGTYDVADARSPQAFDFFERMMAQRPCCIQHTRAQFLTVMEDARLSGHCFVAVARADGDGTPAAMVWARTDELTDDLIVCELLSDDRDAACAALTELQRRMPGRPMTLLTQPGNYGTGLNLMPGGMARVVNVESALEAVAANNPDTSVAVRVTDSLLPENSGVYVLNNGTLKVTDSLSHGRTPDLDLDPTTLTSMLFSSRAIASITGLPSERPRMSLMLD